MSHKLDKLRPYHEMIIRFAKVFEISTDELLGVKPIKSTDVVHRLCNFDNGVKPGVRAGVFVQQF